jgi:hypothetical protein
MSMMRFGVLLAGAALAAVVAIPAEAGSLADQFASCAQKYSVNKAASVMLECTAADGKLSDCKVVDAGAVSGADKAAICVADALPVGSRTGAIKVPIKFDPSK